MYPRNAASPERIAVGAVVQISDGAVQSSGVSITVRGQGGAEGAGAGTTAYGTSGIVYYTPTQGETDFTSFVVIASKTGCIPVAQTIVTSASATAGYAGTDQSKIANPTSTVNLSGTTVKTATDVETDTADIQSRLPAALVSGRIDASVGAMATDVITSTALAASAVTEIQTGLSTLDAAGVRTAVGLASANLDTQLSTIDTVVDSILADTGADGVVVAAGSKTGYTLSATGSAALTEGYAALGAAGTLPQILYEIRALLAEKSISTTTLTTKKLDGTTTAATYTLDDATTPSAITRAT